MKKSIAATTGLVMVAAIGFACADPDPLPEYEDKDADYQQICVQPQPNGELERRPDHECSDRNEDGSSGGSSCAVCWYFLGRAFGRPPAVGTRLPAYSPGSYTRPTTGTIAKPPATGGFGTTRVSVGS